MKFAAIIFDMDGLLVDSEPVWHELEVELIEACGYTYDPEVRDMGIGMRRGTSFARPFCKKHYPRLGATPAAIESAITERMIAAADGRIQARPGADEILRYAAERDIPRAIASSSSQVIIEHFLRLMGWDKLIPKRFSAEFVRRGKTRAPIFYLRGRRRAACRPAGGLPGAGRQPPRHASGPDGPA